MKMPIERYGFCGSLTLLLVVGLVLGGCARAPEVDAGADMDVITGELVGLSGSVETKRDDPVEILWRFVELPAGSEATLTAAETLAPWFVADQAGEYRVELTAEQNELVGRSEVTITASGDPLELTMLPIADAGEDQQVETNEIVRLEGSVTDPSEGHVNVQWRFISVPSGSRADLFASGTLTPWFLADRPGGYVVELEATNAYGIARDRVLVEAEGEPVTHSRYPVARAGGDQIAPAPGYFGPVMGLLTTIQLDGSASYHPDGGPLQFEWVLMSRPEGSRAQFGDSRAEAPTLFIDMEGEYEIALYACDHDVCGHPDSLVVTAEGMRDLEIVTGEDQVAEVATQLESPFVVRAVNSAGQRVPGVPVLWADYSGPEEDYWDYVELEDGDLGVTNENGLSFAYVLLNEVAGERTFTFVAVDEVSETYDEITGLSADFTATGIAGEPWYAFFDEVDPDEEISVLDPYLVTMAVYDEFFNIVTWENDLEFVLALDAIAPAVFADTATHGTLVDGGGTKEIVARVSDGVFSIEVESNIAQELFVDLFIEYQEEGMPEPERELLDWLQLYFEPGPAAKVRFLEGIDFGATDVQAGHPTNVVTVFTDVHGNFVPSPDHAWRFWIHAEGDGEDTPVFDEQAFQYGTILAGGGSASILVEPWQGEVGAFMVLLHDENPELVTLTIEDVGTGLEMDTTTRRFTGAPFALEPTIDTETDPLVGTVGQKLPTAVSVWVVDEEGYRIPNVYVGWWVSEGGGSVEPWYSLTNESGEAIVEAWVLGPEEGEDNNVLEAYLVDYWDVDEVEFVASAVAADPAVVALLPFDQPEPGDDAVELEIEVQDAYGNHLEEDVRFTLFLLGPAAFTGVVDHGSIVHGEDTNVVYVETSGGRLGLEVTSQDLVPVQIGAYDTDRTELRFEGFGGTRIIWSSDFEADDGGMWVYEFQGSSWQHGTPTSGPGEAAVGSKVWATNLHGDAHPDEASCLVSPAFYLPQEGAFEVSFQAWAQLNFGYEWGVYVYSYRCGHLELAYYWSDSPYWSTHEYELPAWFHQDCGDDDAELWVCMWTRGSGVSAPGLYLDDMRVQGEGEYVEIEFSPSTEDDD